MDIEKMHAIVERQTKLEKTMGIRRIDRMTLVCQLMQMETLIDFDRLLEFDDSNFIHDVYGINQHTPSGVSEFTDCFYPRCGK